MNKANYVYPKEKSESRVVHENLRKCDDNTNPESDPSQAFLVSFLR